MQSCRSSLCAARAAKAARAFAALQPRNADAVALKGRTSEYDVAISSCGSSIVDRQSVRPSLKLFALRGCAPLVRRSAKKLLSGSISVFKHAVKIDSCTASRARSSSERDDVKPTAVAVAAVAFATAVGSAAMIPFNPCRAEESPSSGSRTTEFRIELATRSFDGTISAGDIREMSKKTATQHRVYGEITFEGVRSFMDYCLEQLPHWPHSHVFYDLGSGVGRMVMQVAIDYQSIVRRSVGVELSEERHFAALEGRRRLRAELECDERRCIDTAVCEFLHGDVLEAHVSDATIAWVANSFFTDTMLQRLCDKLVDEAPLLQFVGFNDPLSEWDVEFRGFSLDTALRLPMSWDGEAIGYVYKRNECVSEGGVCNASPQPTSLKQLCLDDGRRSLGRDEARRIVNLLWSSVFNEDENEDVILYDLAESEEAFVEGTGGDSTYGEVCFDLLDWLLEEAAVHSDDVICDLGSGSGRALLYLALRSGCRIVGVELSPTRHCAAERLFHLAAPFLARPAVLYEGDITCNGPQSVATVVLFANRLFDEDFSQKALATVPEAQRLLTLRPVEKWGRCIATAALPTTWMPNQPVWLYDRT